MEMRTVVEAQIFAIMALRLRHPRSAAPLREKLLLIHPGCPIFKGRALNWTEFEFRIADI